MVYCDICEVVWFTGSGIVCSGVLQSVCGAGMVWCWYGIVQCRIVYSSHMLYNEL